MSRSARRNNQTNRPAAQVGEPGTGTSETLRMSASGISAATSAAFKYVDFGSPSLTPGRPSSKGFDQQSTPAYISPLNPDSAWGGTMTGDWANYPELVRRPEFLSRNPDLLGPGRINAYSPVEPWRALRAMPRLSAIVGSALRLLQRTANTGLVVSVKNPDSRGLFTIEDEQAGIYLTGLLKNTGTRVESVIPGAMGNLSQHTDSLLCHAFTMGAMSQELVLKNNRKDYSHLAAIDPSTITLHRDRDNNGSYLIGQRHSGAENGWLQFNPELVTYLPVNGVGLGNVYGECEYQTAFSIASIWQGYFGKLALYVQRAAFGFLDGVVKVEILEKMWQHVTPAERAPFRNEFIIWANAMVKYLGDAYKTMGEADPESLMIHLDILEINPAASGKTSFPTTDASEVILDEYFNAVGAPGELFGKKSDTQKHVFSGRMEAYSKVIAHYQQAVAHLYNRAGAAALWAKGWPRKVEVQCYLKPAQMYDRLTTAQAEQIEQLIARFKRDEGLISQDEMSEELISRPALAQHPNARYPDKSGDSTPTPDAMIQENADAGGGASAGGNASSATAARGGANQVRNSDPMADKKN